MATITQKITFKNTTANQLYRMYVDSKIQSEFTGSAAIVSDKVGSKLYVFDGYITGKTLSSVKNKMIVQEWLGADWGENAEKSVLVLTFENKGKNAIIHVCHANVPDEHAKSLDNGWHEYYWDPMKEILGLS